MSDTAALVPGVFLAPGISRKDLADFDPDLVRFGSASPTAGRVLAKMAEEAVAEKVQKVLAPRKSVEFPEDGIVPAVSSYLLDGKADTFAEFGIDPSKEGASEALALSLLEFGYPELASRLAAEIVRDGKRNPFACRFSEVLITAARSAVKEGAPGHLLDELSASMSLVRDALGPVAASADDHYYAAQLNEMYVVSPEEVDIESALRHYEKSLDLGDVRSVLPLADIFFRSALPKEAFELLTNAWERFRTPQIAQELATRYFEHKDYAQGFRYVRVCSFLTGKEIVASAPNEETLNLPTGLLMCQSFLFASERRGGAGGFFRKGVTEKLRDWLLSEFETVSRECVSLENVPESLYEDRLSILQFGAIELSDTQFAAAYLDDLEYHLRREEGKEFLFSYFEEHWSAYARAFSCRIEDDSLDFLRETRPEIASDRSPKRSEGPRITVPEDAFVDLGEALLTHLSFLNYRFQFFGDEEIVERMRKIGSYVSLSDVRNSDVDVSELMNANFRDLQQRERTFEALPERLREWYWSLRKRILDSKGESYLRYLLSTTYYPTKGEVVLENEALMFHIVEAYFSGAKIYGEALDAYLSDLVREKLPDEDIARLAEFLFESGEVESAYDFALHVEDLTNPDAFMTVIRSALAYPDHAAEIDGSFQEETGRRTGMPKSIADFAQELAETRPESALAQRNFALALQAFLGDPKLLRRMALPAFDAAARLGDADSALYAAKMAADELDDLDEAERRFLAAFESGDLRAVVDLCFLYLDQSRPEELERFLKIADRHALVGVENVRFEMLLGGSREDQIEAFRSLPGNFAATKRGLSEDLVQQCGEIARADFFETPSVTSAEFADRFPKFVAARLLAYYPPAPAGEDEPPLDRFPFAAHYLSEISDFLSDPRSKVDFFSFLQNLEELEIPARTLVDAGKVDPESPEIARFVAEMQSLISSMEGTPGYADIVVRVAKLLGRVPGGEEFQSQLVDALSEAMSKKSSHH